MESRNNNERNEKKNTDDNIYKSLKEKDSNIANKYKDDNDKAELMNKKVRKFIKGILGKYSESSTKEIIERAKKIADRYGFDRHEFLNKIVHADKFKQTAEINPLGRALGYTMENTGKLVFDIEDTGNIQYILAKHQENQQLHAELTYQSYLYTDVAPEAISGTYDKNKHNVFSHIPAVIAALYIPKVDYLEKNTIIGSISNIVASLYAGEQIKAKDWELFINLSVDPNNESELMNPFQDLKNRVNIQTQLWKLVRNLRQGRYYQNIDEFMTALNEFKMGLFDTPDLLFVKDEGTMLKKILSTFSLRPTIASISSIIGGNLYSFNYNNFPIGQLGSTQIITLPIINLRLSPSLYNKQLENSIKLSDALSQADHFAESCNNNAIVTKNKEILNSKLLFFYVNRRFQGINYGVNIPCYWTKLPTTLSGVDKLNPVPISVPAFLEIGGESFKRKSIVMVEKKTIFDSTSVSSKRDIIIGSSAAIVQERVEGDRFLVYNPIQAAHVYYDDDGVTIRTLNPFTRYPEFSQNFDEDNDDDNFTGMISRRGTIYMYILQEVNPCL